MSVIRMIRTTTASMIMSMVILLNVLAPAITVTAQVADTTPPVTNASISGTKSNDWYISNASVNLTATDEGSGVNMTVYNLDDTGWNIYTGNLTITDGLHVLEYNSSDNESNAETVKNLTVQVDTKPPVTSMDVAGTKNSNGWYSPPAVVSFSATDSASGVAGIQIYNGSGWVTYTGPISLNGGTYTFVYRAIDNVGHIEQSRTSTVNVNPGTDKPGTSFVFIGTKGIDGWYVTDVVVKFTATGGTGGIDHTEYNLDGAGWAAGSEVTVTSDGCHKLLYRSVDMAGNVEDDRTTWVPVDKFGPVVSASIGGDKASQGWFNGDVTITISATDYGSGVNVTQYCTDGVNWINYSKPFTLGWSLSRSIYYRSVDFQGHYTNSSIYVYFNPPTFESYSLPSESVWINGVTFTPTPTPTVKPKPTATATPIPVSPTPSAVPTSAAETQGSGGLLAIGVLLAVIAVIAIGGIVLYSFVLKPK